MSLTKWTDRGLFPSITSLFDDFFADQDGFLKTAFTGTLPAVNVEETDEAFKLELAAPGKNKEDFNIEVDKNVLTISSEEEARHEEEEKNYTRREYSYRSFRRSFRLPEGTDSATIVAAYDNGVLYVTIPKTADVEMNVKTIPIS